jgi:3-dehydroquinate synthase
MDALRKFDLPTVLAPSTSTDDILSIMKTDKKFKNGKIRFVVLHKLGQAELIESITEDDIKTAIESLRS